MAEQASLKTKQEILGPVTQALLADLQSLKPFLGAKIPSRSNFKDSLSNYLYCFLFVMFAC